MSTKENNKPVQITELVLRDGHQSLFATRMRIDDMLPIAEKIRSDWLLVNGILGWSNF